MFEIVMPGLVLGGFALVFSSGLLAASKKFFVYEDPRIDDVEAMLPGANCGGCGFAGCRAYAENAVKNESLETSCPVAAEEQMQKIASYLGVEAVIGERVVASLMCNGRHEHSPLQIEYGGIDDCWAAYLATDSTKSCAFSCLGLSSCVRTCTFEAMRIENGIVVIDDDKCVGDGACIEACPKGLLHLRPYSKTITVTCKNTERGADARKVCKVACIGCMKCEKVCEDDAIHVNEFLAVIDYAKCTVCGKCVDACPTNAIEIRGDKVYAATA